MRETILTWMTVQSSRQGHLPNPIHATSHDECMRPKARLTVELGEFQAKLPREPSPIEGTPSKTPRRTELKSRELQANDEENALNLARESTLSKRLRPEHPARQDLLEHNISSATTL